MTVRSVDYDRISEHFEQRYVAHEYGGVEATLTRLVRPGARVLDVGCGTGRWLRHLASRDCECVGLDPSLGMLRKASERGGVALTCGLGTRLPFAASSFDAVVAVNALHHFGDANEFVCEAARVLRPRGRILTIGLDPSVADDEWYVYDFFPGTKARDRARYPASAELRRVLARCSFEGIETVAAQRWNESVEAEAYLGQGLAAKSACSQLALLSEKEYADGITSIRAESDRLRLRGEELRLVGRLTLYCTTAVLLA